MSGILNLQEYDGKTVVSARELYDFLEVKRDFTTWCKQMFDYGFVDGFDFTPILGKSTGGRPSIDYGLSIDCAKEISMLQRSEKGKEARQYFIECEKKLLQPMTEEQMTLIVMANLKNKVEEQRTMLTQANETIKLQAPKVEFAEKVLDADELIPITVIAKDLGMTAIALNNKLQELGIQFKVKASGVWVLYAQYQDRGYTKTKTHIHTDRFGKEQSSIQTYWTQRGRAFIHWKLNNLNDIEKTG